MSGQVALQAAIKTGQRVFQSPLVQEVLETGAQVVSENILVSGSGGKTLATALTELIQVGVQPEAVAHVRQFISQTSTNAGAVRQLLGEQAGQFEGVLKQLDDLGQLVTNTGEDGIQEALKNHFSSNPKLAEQLTELDDVVVKLTEQGNVASSPVSTVGKAEGVDEAVATQGKTNQTKTQVDPTDIQVDDVDVDPTREQGGDDFSRGKTSDEPHVENSADANNKGKKLYTEDEVERQVQERLKEIEAQGGTRSGNIPNDPIEKILHGAENIVAGEFSNLSSEVGLLMKATGMTPEKVNGLMRKFVTPELRKDLEAFLKAQLEGHENPLSVISHLTQKEQQGMKWLGRLVNVGSKVPSWAFDTMAFAGNFVDYFDWALRRLPGGNVILGIPFMRKFITGFGQFVGRFSGNIKQIGEGVKEFQTSLAKNASQAAIGLEAVGALAGATSK